MDSLPFIGFQTHNRRIDTHKNKINTDRYTYIQFRHTWTGQTFKKDKTWNIKHIRMSESDLEEAKI